MTLRSQGEKSLFSSYEIGIAAIQQDRASFARTPAQKTARADGRNHSDGAHVGPKRFAAFGRNVA